jgi:nucleoside phosphorylase/predicted Zn-dependent protease
MNTLTELDDVTIGIITALPEEFAAAQLVFLPGTQASSPSNTVYYVCKVPCIQGDRVVAIVVLPTTGNNCSAIQATQMCQDCRNITDILMIGIAGAIPCPNDAKIHVRLGDIVVSGIEGVFQYDLGKEESGKEFVHRTWPTRPSKLMLNAVKHIQAKELLGIFPWDVFIDNTIIKHPNWQRPDDATDILDEGNREVSHPIDTNRRKGYPRLFVGAIASGNRVLKDAVKRDLLANKSNARGFLHGVEMEGSGVQDAAWMEDKNYFVVRGTCDYCNINKNDTWHKYAALIAAAFARSIIEQLPAPPASSTTALMPQVSNNLIPKELVANSDFNNLKIIFRNTETSFTLDLIIPGTGHVRTYIAEGAASDSPIYDNSDDTDKYSERIRRLLSSIQANHAVWEFEPAKNTAIELEGLLTHCQQKLSSRLLLTASLALARIAVIDAENQKQFIDGKPDLLKARRLVAEAEAQARAEGDTNNIYEIESIRAALDGLEYGKDITLTRLLGKKDPFSVRQTLAILLNEQTPYEALAVLDNLEFHERWIDLAAAVYIYNHRFDDAKRAFAWVASRDNKALIKRCAVRMADAYLIDALTNRDSSDEVNPSTISNNDKSRIREAADILEPHLIQVLSSGVIGSEIDLAITKIGWRVKSLLQCHEETTKILKLMSTYFPIQMDIGIGALNGYIESPPDLPNMLRRDHPHDLEANILAGVVQSAIFSQHKEVYGFICELASSAKSDEEKEDLFKLLLQIFPHLDEKEANECESTARALVSHNQKLLVILEGLIKLKIGDPDAAIDILDHNNAQDDVYWLQIKANALLQKQQIGDAVDTLMVALQKSLNPRLLRWAGDLAYKAGKFNNSAWCLERLTEMQPENIGIRGNLAHIYTFSLYDFEKAAIQFRALSSAQPDDPIHILNLAICLTKLYRHEESLALLNQLCSQAEPNINAVLGRSELHLSLGHLDQALTSLNEYRKLFWADTSFLFAYLNTAYAAGDETAANDALNELNKLREEGKVDPTGFRKIHKDEALKLIGQSYKEAFDRNEFLHTEIVKGRMPWVWADRLSNTPLCFGWRARTQKMTWIGDEPNTRARFSIYSTNGFHARKSEDGIRTLSPIECPPSGTKIVADISALITLHRLGLLDDAANYFGEVLVPACYLATVLEDSRQLVLHQRSRKQSAERLIKKVETGQIAIIEDDITNKAGICIADEYRDSNDTCYRLTDLINPLHKAGVVSDIEFSRIIKTCQKPSVVGSNYKVLEHLQDVQVGLSTLETVTQFGMLDALSSFYHIRITSEDSSELHQHLEAIRHQEETREWYIDLWNHIRGDARFKFIVHPLPEQASQNNTSLEDNLPFLACFISMDTKIPLLSDDRLCQAIVLNELNDEPHAAFGTDSMLLALMKSGRLNAFKVGSAFSQLIQWRYRFIILQPEVLKVIAEQYRGNPPGQPLHEIAEYVHDCMRDPGLFSGPERTDHIESMAKRLYLSWVSTVAKFLVLVWNDETFTDDAAKRLTEWSLKELLPSTPRVLDGHAKVNISSNTKSYFVYQALTHASFYPPNPRLVDAMKAIKSGLQLGDDQYFRIITEILNDFSKTESES